MSTINLSAVQEKVYNKIGNELTCRHDFMWTLPPQKLVWRGKRRNCDVTGKVIKRGQECIILFAALEGCEERKILMVLSDETALSRLLDLGSLTSLDVYKREMVERAEENKPKPILPHQNICYCVQCGQKIVRPEGMSLVLFAKVYRCAVCQESGIAMAMNQSRYCRVCGVSFMPDEHSSRNCPRCFNGSSHPHRLESYKKNLKEIESN